MASGQEAETAHHGSVEAEISRPGFASDELKTTVDFLLPGMAQYSYFVLTEFERHRRGAAGNLGVA
jgi:hypothetical protein